MKNKPSCSDAVLEVIRDNPDITKASIVKALDLPVEQVTNALLWLQENGFVIREEEWSR